MQAPTPSARVARHRRFSCQSKFRRGIRQALVGRMGHNRRQRRQFPAVRLIVHRPGGRRDDPLIGIIEKRGQPPGLLPPEGNDGTQPYRESWVVGQFGSNDGVPPPCFAGRGGALERAPSIL